ncbi:MAG TPA: DUF885 domain-containing protein [Streptosporangiaceae bacterium]|jgi:uncharacterized protein (DUF885 family)
MPGELTVQELCDSAWARVLDRDPATAMRCRGQVEALPPGGPAAMEHDVSVAKSALSQLAGREGLDAAFLRDHLQQEAAEAQRFWYRFPVTPYNASPLGGYRSGIFTAAELRTAADADRYRKLLDDYLALAEQIGETLAAQRARGIRLPAWAVPAVLATVRGHADASAELILAPERLARLAPGPAGRLADGVRRVVQGRLAAAWRRLLDDLDADARDGADGAGIGQFPGGQECYAGLIRLHTGLDLSAEEVHAIGLAEVARITERIRGELAISDEPAYRRSLAADPRMYATSSADVERLFGRHIDRAMAELPRYFARLPAAPFRIRPLAAALSGLTYGYYEPPGADGAGYYHYNVADLPERPLVQAASVIYHEGMPGHHLQVGRQMENTALHPIRRELTELRTFALNGYLEGWAEYAAGFCDEIGLYADPLDRYGRLSSERFHAARLVVDTGLNVLGWTRDRAAAYLRASGFLSDVEVDSEVLRYAVDDPGQALAYHLGHWHLRRLRGTRDARQFHEAVLAEGPLPLTLLDDLVIEA